MTTAAAATLPGRLRLAGSWPLAVIVGLAGLVRLAFSASISGNDDLSVATCALRLLDGASLLGQGHYCARVGLTAPLAAIFALGGTGTVQLSILPAIASIASMLLAWRLGCLLFGPAAGLAAAAVIALFPMDVEFAGLLFPDVPQGALVAGALLCALSAKGSRRGDGLALLGGALWAWAYYVKLDAFVLGPLLLVAVLLGFVSWRHAIVMGITASAFVGVELVAYGRLAGDPLRHLHLESASANEVLAAGMDYRNLLTFPKTMFLVPYETGLMYFVWLAAAGTALVSRTRPLLLLLVWCLTWQLWLMFGADPFAGFRLKPQLGRYLLSWEVPMAVMVGWFWTWLVARQRRLGLGLVFAAAASLIVLGSFNQLSTKPAQATRIAVSEALARGWFPLYPDVQSIGIAGFLLHGRPEASQVFPVQRHDFLKGVTTFEPIRSVPAYLLINRAYARQLQTRNLVRPIDPDSFGLQPTQVFEVDRPGSPVSYASLRLLAWVAGFVPGPLGRKAEGTVAELLRPGDAVVYRLE